MKLLKSITILVFLLSTTLSCAQWEGKKIKGNGNITTITRTTSDYDGIKATGPMDFKLDPGTEGSITIKGDANLMEYIITEVKNGNLVVKVKNGVNLRPSQTIVVIVPYETIDNVSLAGSGDVKNTGSISSNSFDVSLAGSGDINLKIEAQTVESSIAGSGDVELRGSTKDLTTKITGSGDFNGSVLNSTNVQAKITGSGNADIVCNSELKVRITGSGDVKYSGNPTNKDTKITGSGSVSN
ncbi:head GIN domain-containing protein [Winogradskyella sp.]|uniref:head GIN domain-containing protein n=1 Tax=Winogradskyella sp. TaxID=1883156 RepID=UPI003F6BBB1A